MSMKWPKSLILIHHRPKSRILSRKKIIIDSWITGLQFSGEIHLVGVDEAKERSEDYETKYILKNVQCSYRQLVVYNIAL